MTSQEIIDSLGLQIQGYAGYDTLENRMDTLDVFSAWIHGRIKKKIDDLDSQFKTWATLPDFPSIAPVHQKVIETLKIILKHMKYDSKDIAPFNAEPLLFEEAVLSDLLVLDERAYTLEEKFCKALENLKGMTLPLIQESLKTAEDLLDALRERTKRIAALNHLCNLLQQNVKHYCDLIASEKLDEKTIKAIYLLLDQYPKRVETLERVLEAFRLGKVYYQDYVESPLFHSKYPAFLLYLEHYPKLLKRAETFLASSKPVGDKEKRLFESVKKALEAPPDFKALKAQLELVVEAIEQKKGT